MTLLVLLVSFDVDTGMGHRLKLSKPQYSDGDFRGTFIEIDVPLILLGLRKLSHTDSKQFVDNNVGTALQT